MKEKIENQIQFTTKDPVLRNKINIGNFDMIKFLPKIIDKITKEPQYLVWNEGKPILNKTGGLDAIAWLYKDKNGVIQGWSR